MATLREMVENMTPEQKLMNLISETLDVFNDRPVHLSGYSTEKENIFSEGVKYISIDDSLQANIINLIPGQNYFFLY